MRKTPSLYDSTAVLTQKHQLFSLAVSENIGIGDQLHSADEERISGAASRVGVGELIEKLENEKNYLMEPDSTLYATQPLGSGCLFNFSTCWLGIRPYPVRVHRVLVAP